jgi:hypothetical protein
MPMDNRGGDDHFRSRAYETLAKIEQAPIPCPTCHGETLRRILIAYRGRKMCATCFHDAVRGDVARFRREVLPIYVGHRERRGGDA